ncbi:metal-binding protein [Croceicoccus estronivorus]|nr:metal-binding protein [Croceicoccus estronivorus]
MGGFLAVLTACSGVAQAASYTMYRDPYCGCCEQWADHVRAKMKVAIAVDERQDMASVKDRHAVPSSMRSCHTMVIDGYVIEGHVPASDIARLLRERPEGVKGLAVPGMPLGSPGMEMGGERQAYQVIAFGPAGNRIYSNHN